MSFTKQDIETIESTLSPFNDNNELAIAKIAHGHVDFYGAKKQNGTVVPAINQNSVFEIGSITKVFTSYLLCDMILRGDVQIDDAINSAIPVPFKNGATITYKALASHTSGLPRLPPGLIWSALFKNPQDPYKEYQEPQLLNYLENKLKLSAKIKHVYSNLGAGLLGYTLSRVAETSYEDLLQRALFEPLKMTRSTTNLTALKPWLVQGLDGKGRPVSNWDLGILSGAGAVLSTVEDLSAFALSCFDPSNSVFQFQKQPVFKDANASHALGWVVLNLKEKGEHFYFHNGGTGGYSSCMLLDTQNQVGFVALSNITGMSKFKEPAMDKLVFDLMEDTISQ
ncbi:serine hydrolase domain-containing protein [Vibrio penaeicida]|uniref:Beta-lactamase-related domain-containing protein n=1 Tax=Vibrio penaeicida TaxID=104609 RepID=A0AAV5NW25_9VIBR|nr:serine hydrolase domain-containing protein [Vibrio penaeicida]GLQ74797.1 hypothetical protein GCM10007932_41590 [Vibrio penaeicida]